MITTSIVRRARLAAAFALIAAAAACGGSASGPEWPAPVTAGPAFPPAALAAVVNPTEAALPTGWQVTGFTGTMPPTSDIAVQGIKTAADCDRLPGGFARVIFPPQYDVMNVTGTVMDSKHDVAYLYAVGFHPGGAAQWLTVLRTALGPCSAAQFHLGSQPWTLAVTPLAAVGEEAYHFAMATDDLREDGINDEDLLVARVGDMLVAVGFVNVGDVPLDALTSLLKTAVGHAENAAASVA